MREIVAASLAFLALLAPAGCRSRASKDQERDERRVSTDAAMRAKIPPDSPLVSVTLGMAEGEVRGVLGNPDAQEVYASGKAVATADGASKDVVRAIWYFKGLGRVSFSTGAWGARTGVSAVEYDPDESGVRRAAGR